MRNKMVVFAAGSILALFVLSRVVIPPVISIVLSVIFWMVSGAIAGRIIRGKGYGFIGNTVLGLVGGITGTVIFWVLGWSSITRIAVIDQILIGVIGSVILVVLVRLLHNADFGR